jgi:hypothetical protein
MQGAFMFNIKYNLSIIPDIISETMGIMQEFKAEDKYLSLILGTIAVESGFEWRISRDRTKFGLAMMNVKLVENIFHNIENNLGEYHKLTKLWINLDTIPFFIPGAGEIREHLMFNDLFSTALLFLDYKYCDLHVERIPTKLSEQASYYSKYYNLTKNAEEFLGAAEKYSIKDFLETFEKLKAG